MALFLDTHYRLLSAEVLFMGSVDSAPFYTRVVASRALAHHCLLYTSDAADEE